MPPMEGWQPTCLDGGFQPGTDEHVYSEQLGRALDIGQSPQASPHMHAHSEQLGGTLDIEESPQAPDVEPPSPPQEVVAVSMMPAYDDPLRPEEECEEELDWEGDDIGGTVDSIPISPNSRTFTWVHVEALPQVEGDDIEFDKHLAHNIDVEGMKRWCESNSHCVGFAHWADQRKHFHMEGWIFPKERATGFDEHSVVWIKEKHPNQVWHWYYIKERAQPTIKIDSTDVASKIATSTSLINANAAYVPLPDCRVPEYLAARGFTALDTITWALAGPSEWIHRMPCVRFGVKHHEEAGSHTWYTVEASISMPEGCLRQTWKAPRRLLHLRQFRDHLRAALGKEGYTKIFTTHTGERVPFAARGGVPGTTTKLDAWLCTLANTINNGSTTPSVVAAALHFLRAPPLHDDADSDDGIDPYDEGQVSASSPVCSPLAASDASPHPNQLV